MTRLLYDVAVITDYSRRQDNSEAGKPVQHQLTTKRTHEAMADPNTDILSSFIWLNQHSDPEPFAIEKEGDNTDEKDGKSTAEKKAESIVKREWRSTVDEESGSTVENCQVEMAHSVSGYSSVGTLSSQFGQSSVSSVDLANILWIDSRSSTDREFRTPSSSDQSNYETCNEDPTEMPRKACLVAELTDCPTSLNRNLKSEKEPRAGVSHDLHMYHPYFLFAETTGQPTCDNQTNVQQAGHLGHDGALLEYYLMDRKLDWKEEQHLEVSLHRVAEQLYQLKTQMLTDAFEREHLGKETDVRDADPMDQATAVQNIPSVEGPDSVSAQLVESSDLPQQAHHNVSNNATKGDVWFTAESEQDSIDERWSQCSFEISTTDVSHYSEGCEEEKGEEEGGGGGGERGEQREREESEEEEEERQGQKVSVHQNRQHPSTVNEVITSPANLMDGRDIGIEIGDVTNQTKDASNLSLPHNSMAEPDVVSMKGTHTVVASHAGLCVTVNDSGFGNSVFSPNATRNKTPFKLNHQPITISNTTTVQADEKKQTKDNECSRNTNYYHANSNEAISGALDSPKREIGSRPILIPRLEGKDSPYHCKVHHGGDFLDVSTFISSGPLPDKYLTDSNVKCIMAISQRIVRIQVRKPYLPADPYFDKNTEDVIKVVADGDRDSLDVDHYGTGFAFYVGPDQIQIRTHSRLVGSTAEAGKTEVQFNIFDTSNGDWHQVECMGQVDGFYTNVHSHTSIISCATPPPLKSLLHLFHSIPVDIKASLFNDSSYFTDSSPETSFFTKEVREHRLLGDVQKDDGDDVGFNDNETSGSCPSLAASIGSGSASWPEDELDRDLLKLETFGDPQQNAVDPPWDMPRNAKAYDSRESIDLGYSENTENPFEYCGTEEIVVREAFESIIATENPETDEPMLNPTNDSSDDVFDDGKGSNPSNHNLNSAEAIASLAQKDSVAPVRALMTSDVIHPSLANGLDYPGARGYQPFHSYAGDVLKSSKPSMDVSLQASILDVCLDQWDFESMLYIQNQRRDEYIQTFANGARCSVPNAMSQRSRGLNQTSHTPARDTAKHSELQSYDKMSNGMLRMGTKSNQEHLHQTLMHAHRSKNSVYPVLSQQQGISTLSTGDPNLSQVRQNLNAKFDTCQNGITPEGDDPWDSDLLGLDTKLLCRLHSDIELEKLVEDILSEEDDVFNILSHEFAPRVTTGDERLQVAFMMSHPHGGVKQVSCGRLTAVSDSTPADGDFYDAPSCFGCCGAPVLSFSKTGHVFVSTIVHNGTTQIGKRGVYRGFGLSFLPQSPLEFSQCVSV